MHMQVDAFLECSVGSLMHLFPDQLQHALQLTFINNMQQHQPSQMAKEISEGLSALGIPHSGPYLMEHGPVLVDIALLGPCPAIALQVEDPGQLAVNAPWLPLGSTRLKQQTLRSNGWQVFLTSSAPPEQFYSHICTTVQHTYHHISSVIISCHTSYTKHLHAHVHLMFCEHAHHSITNSANVIACCTVL